MTKFVDMLKDFLQWLPADHLADVQCSLDGRGREVLTVEGMSVTLHMRPDPHYPQDSDNPQRLLILTSNSSGLKHFTVSLNRIRSIGEKEKLIIRGYFAEHQRHASATIIEVG